MRVRDGSTLAEDDVRAHVADRLAAFKVPAHVWIVERRAAAQRERQGAQARAPREGAVVVSGYTELRYDVDDHVAIITLDRPEARNALTFTTYAELTDAVATTKARCLVVTGRDPAFCSGDDVKQIMANAGAQVSSDLAAEPRITPAAAALLETDVPVIAAVNGAAVGWGMELAIMADIRVASERAKFGELFVKRGLCCDVAGLARLAQLVGREAAAELLFTGRIVDAATAKELRLVSRVVPHDELMATALSLARRDRREPAARGPEAEGRTASGPRPRLRGPRPLGDVVPRRSLPNRGPQGGRRVVPGEARTELRRPLSAACLLPSHATSASSSCRVGPGAWYGSFVLATSRIRSSTPGRPITSSG